MVTRLLFGMRILLTRAAHGQAYYRPKLALQLTNQVAFFCLHFLENVRNIWKCDAASLFRSPPCLWGSFASVSTLFPHLLFAEAETTTALWFPQGHSSTVPTSGKGPLMAPVHLTGCSCILTHSIGCFICSYCCCVYPRSERLQEFLEAILCSPHAVPQLCFPELIKTVTLLLGFSCTLQMLNRCSTHLCYLLRLF